MKHYDEHFASDKLPVVQNVFELYGRRNGKRFSCLFDDRTCPIDATRLLK